MSKKKNFFRQSGNPIPLANIVSEWKFDNSESRLIDTVGSNDGSQLGSVSYSTGLVGDMINLTSSPIGGVSVADDDTLSFGNGTTDSPFSFSLAFYPFVDLTTSINPILVDRRATDNSSREYSIGWSGSTLSGSLFFRLFDTTSNSSGTNQFIERYYTLTSISSGSWHHLIGTYDGSGNATGIKLYYDGIEVSTGTTDTGSYTAMGNKAIPLVFGRLAASTALSFTGFLDVIRIWNKELTAEECSLIATDELAGIDINP